jgi:hypothetical protein
MTSLNCVNTTSDCVLYAVEKQCVTYSEWVSVALDIQRAKRMRRITLAPIVCPAAQCLSALSHKRHDFRKTVYFSTTFVWNISHSNNNSTR